MSRNIKLIEQKVVQVVERLREIRDQRRELEQEVHNLRERLAGIEASTPDGLDDFQASRDEAVALIRETLSEIRET